jgi:ABC-type phosphate transport system permease subunit
MRYKLSNKKQKCSEESRASSWGFAKHREEKETLMAKKSGCSLTFYTLLALGFCVLLRYAVFEMQDENATLGILAGTVVGFIPFAISWKDGEPTILGSVAFICCGFLGFVGGLILAIPAAIIFSIIIRKKK